MNVKDHIIVEDFEVLARVGHTKEERAFPQVVTLNIHVYLPLAKAAKNDRMNTTFDYALLIKKTERHLASKSFVLIEALAESVAKIALEHPLTEAVAVKATKKVFANIRAVGASIWREK